MDMPQFLLNDAKVAEEMHTDNYIQLNTCKGQRKRGVCYLKQIEMLKKGLFKKMYTGVILSTYTHKKPPLIVLHSFLIFRQQLKYYLFLDLSVSMQTSITVKTITSCFQ